MINMNNDNWQEIRYFTDLSMNADFSGVSISAQTMDLGCVQLVWAGSTSSKSKFNVEASIDNENWCAIFPDTAVKRSSNGAGCCMYTIENMSWPYLRVRYERVQTNAGTMQCHVFLKRRRANNP